MQLIPDWRRAWRLVSLQIVAVGAALQASIIAFPDFKDWLGDKMSHYVGLLMLVGIAAGRLVKQKDRDDKAP